MTVKLLAPRMAEGVDEITVVKWLKQEGDTVKEYESVVEVETDKVVTEIPSPSDGVLLKILVPPNTAVKVGESLAEIGQPGETAALSEKVSTAPLEVPSAIEKETVTGQEVLRPAPSGRSWVSPLVQKMAAEHQVDLSLVQGTGTGGRVTREDLENYLNRTPGQSAVQAPKLVSAPPVTETKPAIPISGQLLPVSSIRKQIAERMVQSVLTAPHVLTVMEADLSRVLVHREQNLAGFAAQGIHLTLTAYFMSAAASALRTHPLANSSWTENGIELHAQINIGMAVSLGDDGLIVPVIKNADSLSLVGMALAVNDLADRARSKRLLPDDVKGGTFSLTNHGSGKSLFASPIINQPQVAILGTGALQKRPVVVTDAAGNDAIAIRPMIYLSFVFDHRILDGASADGFLMAVKENLENWRE